MTLTLEAARSWSRNNDRKYENRRAYKERKFYGPVNDESRGRRSDKPNIILVITDDQDELLGKT